MKPLVFSQAGVYRLQQLATLVRQKTGVRHQLSDIKSTINLLRFSCTSPDLDVYERYGQFAEELGDEQREYLQGRGLLMPAKAFTRVHIDENHQPTAL
jgi:hypothetical protein